MKVQRVGGSANKATLPWPNISLVPLFKTQPTDKTQHQWQHKHRIRIVFALVQCPIVHILPQLHSCSGIPMLLVLLSNDSFSLLLDLSNNAKCLATEQGKQVSDSCSFQLKMILTKSAIQLFRAKTHHWKGSALLVGFHATCPKTVLRRSLSRICLVFDVFRHSQGTTSDSCAGHSIFWTWNGRDVLVAKQY